MNKLCQHFTPLWLAEALVDRYFPRLSSADCILEPSCGLGAFLQGIPSGVPAVGVEIDPQLAEQAARSTGRRVIVGDFRTARLDFTPSGVIGNPPFIAEVFDGFLDRCHALLPEGGRAGFILPGYFMRSAEKVCRWNDRWAIAVELIPRSAFATRMHTPLLFALFEKGGARRLVGFALYGHTLAVEKMPAPYREALRASTGSMWRAVCRVALERLGGRATLPAIYLELERARPTPSRTWQAKIRQTLRLYADDFAALGDGLYQLRGAP